MLILSPWYVGEISWCPSSYLTVVFAFKMSVINAVFLLSTTRFCFTSRCHWLAVIQIDN